VTTRKQQNACLEIGIVIYPDCLESAVFGLTEFFLVANRYANCHKETQGLSIRVTHWRSSPRAGKRIQCVYDSHRGMGRGTPRILIAPPSIGNPISSEEAAPYVDWLARLHARGSTVTSVCCGAFLLAEAKLLDERTVTTHWYYVEAFRVRYPAVVVDADKLVIDDGDIITAGGMTAWTNLATRLIHHLLGPTVMSETTRFMLVDPSGREQSY
jgi:transcriptional regulator GlxA family with amidase domain